MSSGSGNAQWNGEVKQIEQRGHQLGAHAWTPGRNLSTLQTNDIKTEMYKLESTFVGAVGKFPTYFRPPYDSCTGACPQALATLGYHITYSPLPLFSLFSLLSSSGLDANINPNLRLATRMPTPMIQSQRCSMPSTRFWPESRTASPSRQMPWRLWISSLSLSTMPAKPWLTT